MVTNCINDTNKLVGLVCLTELNLAHLDSDLVRDQFGVNDEQGEGLRKKGITNLFLIVVTNQSKNPAVIPALLGSKELFVPLVDTKFGGFGTPLKEAEQKIEVKPLDRKLREQILASRYLAVMDAQEKRHKCKCQFLKRLKKKIKEITPS